MKSPWCWSLVPVLLLQTVNGQTSSVQANMPSGGSEVLDPVPFQLRHDFLVVVGGRIGSFEHLKFIVDTGASRTVVSARFATQLKLRRQPASTIAVGRRLKLEYAMFPEVQVGQLAAVNRQMLVGDLEKISEFGVGVDAILGMDILGRCRALEIDYAAQQLRFVKPCTQPNQQHAATNYFFVLATLEGRPIHLQVDTGMQGIFLFEKQLRSHVKNWESKDPVAVFMGSSRLEQVHLPSLWLGPVQVSAPVFVMPDRQDGLPEEMDGMLGPRAMNVQRIVLDFEARTFRFR